MAYFSNGCEGQVLDEMCCRCAHYEGCNVFFLQMDWNYGQFADTDEARAKKKALDLLIPQRKNAGGYLDTTCSMFIPLESLTEEARLQATERQRADAELEKLAEHERIYGKRSGAER